MQKNINEKKAVLDFAYNFEDVVKRNNWVTRYDIDTDSFTISSKKLPNDARLKYFGNEFAFYLTKKGEVKGIFIEYFKKNFVKHNKKIIEINDILNKAASEQREEDGSSLLELKKHQLKNKLLRGLEEALESSLAERLNLEPCSC
jgi:hypothetical protein